jgi:hypothetical protein
VSVASILLPVFVLVALTLGLLAWTGRARFAAFRAGDVKMRDVALGQRNWPARPQQIANTFQNQLELPVLFYVLVALALITKQADLVFVVMSWAFVATRLVHAYIYATSNLVIRRFQAFLAGAIILMVMWIVFAVRILLSGTGL